MTVTPISVRLAAGVSPLAPSTMNARHEASAGQFLASPSNVTWLEVPSNETVSPLGTSNGSAAPLEFSARIVTGPAQSNT